MVELPGEWNVTTCAGSAKPSTLYVVIINKYSLLFDAIFPETPDHQALVLIVWGLPNIGHALCSSITKDMGWSGSISNELGH